MNDEPPFSDDLLDGCNAIARFLWGRHGDPRRVQRAVKKGEIPTFTIGGRIQARKSTLRKFIEDQEASSVSHLRS